MNFAAATKTLLAPDANLPQRDMLLDPRHMAERISTRLSKNGTLSFEDCQIARVKYRFSENLRVLYDVKLDGQNLKIASRTFTHERAESVLEESLLRVNDNGIATRPGFFDEEMSAVFWAFPNDRKIKNLHVLSTLPADLAEHVPGWASSRLVAYVPEKCATAQCLDKYGKVLAYAKVFASGDGKVYLNIYNKLFHAGIKIPRSLSYSEKYRVLFPEAADGKRLSDLTVNDSLEVYGKFGAEIARLHSVKDFSNLQLREKLGRERLPRVMRNLKKARPDMGEQAEVLLNKLLDYLFTAERNVLLHGDVHEKNIICTGENVTLIDFDQAATGNPACDIGSFLAGLHYKECVGEMSSQTRETITENFLAGYESIRKPPEKESQKWHTAAALFAERAMRAIHRVRVDGLKNMSEILRRSRDILDG